MKFGSPFGWREGLAFLIALMMEVSRAVSVSFPIFAGELPAWAMIATVWGWHSVSERTSASLTVYFEITWQSAFVRYH